MVDMLTCENVRIKVIVKGGNTAWLENDQAAFSFTIYDAFQGGNIHWTESHYRISIIG